MVAVQAGTILQVLKEALAMPSMVKSKADPFETLVVTIISQNTADRNTAVAYENLSKQTEINPEVLAKADASQIEECIKVGGLFKSKTRTIQAASRIILERFGGSLAPVLSLPLDEARKTLMGMPGVGPKTADVVLLFSVGQPTIPVDTHVNRVSKRLGFAPQNGNYEDVRKSLQSLFSPKEYLFVHLLLIAHGRQYCKAHKPSCLQCPVNIYCPSEGRV
jgi:endonuclease-3